MKIKKVTYSALVNLGDYQNERIGMVAHLEEGDSPDAAIEELRRRVTEISGPRLADMQTKRWELRNELRDLESQLQTTRESWVRTAEFLKAQGIRSDPPEFPEFVKLLNPAAVEEVEVVEAEEYEDDDGDDDEDQF